MNLVATMSVRLDRYVGRTLANELWPLATAKTNQAGNAQEMMEYGPPIGIRQHCDGCTVFVYHRIMCLGTNLMLRFSFEV